MDNFNDNVRENLRSKSKCLLFINIVLWIFFPITFIAFFIYIFIIIGISISSVRKILLSARNFSNLPKYCQTSKCEIEIDSRTQFYSYVLYVKHILESVQEKLSNFKGCYLDRNFNKAIQNIIDKTCRRIGNVLRRLDSNCNAISLQEVKYELRSIHHCIKNVMRLEADKCVFYNLFSWFSLPHVVSNLDHEVEDIFLECQDIINYILPYADEFANSSVDDPSVSNPKNILPCAEKSASSSIDDSSVSKPSSIARSC